MNSLKSVAILLIALLLMACERYEEDPRKTTKSNTSRIKGIWNLTRTTVSSETVPANNYALAWDTLIGFETLHFQSHKTVVSTTNIWSAPDVHAATGVYKFPTRNKTLKITWSNSDDTVFVSEILKLTDTELKFRHEYTTHTNVHEYDKQ